MRVLISGGTGFVGRFATRALLDAGHEVRVLARDAEKARRVLPSEAEIIEGQPLRGDDVAGALSGRDALVQAAAIYSYQRRDTNRMLVETPLLARSTLGAAKAAGVRVVDISSCVVFSLDAPIFNEATPLAGPRSPGWGDPYLQAKVMAERVGRDLEHDGLDRVTLHPTLVVGPEDDGPGTSGTVLLALLRGDLYAAARLGWVDVRDLAQAVVAALDAPSGSNHVISGSNLTHRQIAEHIDRLTGRRTRRLFLSPRMVRLFGRLNDRAGGRLMDVPAAPAIEFAVGSPPVDGSRAIDTLGIHYRDLDETLADAIRWWAANGVVDRKLAGRLARA